MLEQINLYIGGLARAESIMDFFAHLNAQPKECGVFAVPRLHFPFAPDCSIDAIPSRMEDATFAVPVRSAILEIQQCVQQFPHIHTAALNLSLHNFQILRIHIWVHLLRVHFPSVSIKIFFYPSLPEAELEANEFLITKQAYSFYLPMYRQWVMYAIRPFNAYVDSLQSIENCTVDIARDNGEYTYESVFSWLANSLSIPLPENAPLLASSSQQLFPMAKRDTLRFMEYVNSAFGLPGVQGNLPWAEEKDFLAGGDDNGLLLSPEFRKELWERYMRQNQQCAQHFDPREYFAEARRRMDARYADWQPPNPLAWDGAVRLARLLSPEFVKQVLDSPVFPEENQRKGSRLCLNAIKAIQGGCARPCTSIPSKVTVLTATYNHAKYIGETIESVLAQETDFPVAHVIADDGSDDGTQDIIMDYARRHPSITPVLQKEHIGGHINYMALFEGTENPYVAICDGDDYFTAPDKLQVQANFLDAHKDSALCFHVVRVLYEDEPERVRYYPPVEALPRGIRQFYYLSDLIKCNFIQTNSVMYRWRFAKGLPDWFRTNICPGDWYWHLLHAEIGKIGFINKEMSVYRRHKGGVFYLAELDHLKHRFKIGKAELETYDAINRHFANRYFDILANLADGVIADTSRYINNTPDCEQSLEEYHITMAQSYPRFMLHFLERLEQMRQSSPSHNNAQ